MAKIPPYTIPSEEEVDAGRRFQTYVNYTSRLSLFLRSQYKTAADFVRPLAQASAFQGIQGGKCSNFGSLEKMIRNAWLTEIQMAIAAPADELLPYSNHWAPVQLYYSTYLELRALFVASGTVVSGHHTGTLRQISSTISQRPTLFASPWNCLCLGGASNANSTYENLPPGCSVDMVSSLEILPDFWDSYGMFLRTTRKRQLDRSVDAWKAKQRRRNIPLVERTKIASALPGTSIFDALYRLRLRSNYEDADTFLLTLDNQSGAQQFGRALRTIGWFTHLQLELLIARYVGKKLYGRLVDSFGRYEIGSFSEGLNRARWRAIKAVL